MNEILALPFPVQIFLALCALLFSAGLGFGGGKLSRVFGSTTEQKVELKLPDPAPAPPAGASGKCRFNPEEDCNEHEAEKQRSLRNEANIGNIFGMLGAIRTDLGEVKGDVGEVKGMVNVLVEQSKAKK